MQQASYEQQRYDGWYNNLAHPAWGTVDSHLVRKTPPSYADGVYMMSGGDRPSPRNLSQAFMRGLDGLPSLKNRTAMQTFFGQVCLQPILPGSFQSRSFIFENPQITRICLVSSFAIDLIQRVLITPQINVADSSFWFGLRFLCHVQKILQISKS